MKVKCFGCAAQIEGDDTDAIVDEFFAHGRQSHTWSYPEEAIRNYARPSLSPPRHSSMPHRQSCRRSRPTCARGRSGTGTSAR